MDSTVTNVTNIVQTHLPYIDNKFYLKTNSNKKDGNIFHSNMKLYLTEGISKFYSTSIYNLGFNNFRNEFLDSSEKLVPLYLEYEISFEHIKGKIDAIFQYGGKNILVEWKTNVMDYIGFGFGVSNLTKNIRNCNYHRAILQSFLYKNIFERTYNSNSTCKIDEIWIIYFNPIYNSRGGFCISKIDVNSEFNDIASNILDNNFYFIQPLNHNNFIYKNNSISNCENINVLKNYIGKGYLPTTTSVISVMIDFYNIYCIYKDDFEIFKYLIDSGEYELDDLLELINFPEISNSIRMYLFYSNLCIDCCITK